MSTSFAELLELCSLGKAAPQVDSRLIKQGDIFVAVHGENQNGTIYAKQAAQQGAAYIVAENVSNDTNLQNLSANCQIIEHPNTREAIWQLAQAFFHTQKNSLKIIGITGTNGKTTTAYLLEAIFNYSGEKAGVLGTVSYRWPGYSSDAPLTTPGPLDLHRMLAAMSAAGASYGIMEVSSHALSQQRVGGVPFTGAIFTNLTQDHLDFHTDLESYFRAKASLFLALPKHDKFLAINADDLYGRRLLELLPNAVSFGLYSAYPERKHLSGKIISSTIHGLKLRMTYGKDSWTLTSPLVGKFNALNLLGTQALALQLGFTPEQFACLEEFHGVCGRLERVKNDRNLNVFVDYAHTPDALTNVLKALRGAGFKRIVTVFGCGGNRDRSKRPLMGKAVAELSDVAILTSDNPRYEDPLDILQDVKPGLANSAQTIIEPDRRLATQKGIELLNPEDALLIAGKGHENYQLIQGIKHHYSDQEVVKELINCI